MFPCERCGACCRKIGKAPMTRHMAKDNGVCKYLNEVTNLCMIYPDRPITCRVDAFYEQYYKDKMSREEFYRIHKELCKKFQNESPSHKIQGKSQLIAAKKKNRREVKRGVDVVQFVKNVIFY